MNSSSEKPLAAAPTSAAKITLCIETLFPEGSICFASKSDILCEKSWARGISHSELLTYNIENGLNECGYKASDLQFIVVDHGPGSFTGIRVGLNTARALSYALNIPLFTLSSLEILAWQTWMDTKTFEPIWVAVNAYQGLIYLAEYGWSGQTWQTLRQPCVVNPQQLRELLATNAHPNAFCIAGDAWKLADDRLNTHSFGPINWGHESTFTSATVMFECFQQTQTCRKPIVWKDALPLYLRASGAEERR